MNLNEILAIAAKRTPTGSYYALAKAMHRTEGNIGDWKNGRCAPGVDACAELAKLANIPLEQVIDAARQARQEKKRTGKRAQLALSLTSIALAIFVGLSTLVTAKKTQANESTAYPTPLSKITVYYVKFKAWINDQRRAHNAHSIDAALSTG